MLHYKRAKKNILLIALSITLLILVGILLFSCSNQTEKNLAKISTVDTLILKDNDGVALPDIYLEYDNGECVLSEANNFWYNARNCYMKDNKIFLKIHAPEAFTDSLEISYRKNTNILTNIIILKQFSKIEKITISAENIENACEQGESLNISSTIYPTRTNNYFLTYNITKGSEFAQIDQDGLLSIFELATVGEEIWINVVATPSDQSLSDEITGGTIKSNILVVTIKKSFNTIRVDNLVQTVTLPNREGYVFSGYYTDRDGRGILVFNINGERMIDNIGDESELTLYAYWIVYPPILI
ncbi:MAG: InlB B-repeat-containing protein [Christensenellaceae bacterium]|jgi:hypothetical protein|nr:InlB B-repeat-containing protein [Christensenellaceae bacterium]